MKPHDHPDFDRSGEAVNVRYDAVVITFYKTFEGPGACTLTLDQPGDQSNPHVLALVALAQERNAAKALASTDPPSFGPIS